MGFRVRGVACWCWGAIFELQALRFRVRSKALNRKSGPHSDSNPEMEEEQSNSVWKYSRA